MALKDCTFFVDVNGKQVEMDYDQFRSYLLDGTNLSALAPTLAQKKGAKAGFETAQKAEPAPARAEAPKARAEASTAKGEAKAQKGEAKAQKGEAAPEKGEAPTKKKEEKAAPEAKELPPNAPRPVTVENLRLTMGLNKSQAEAVMAVYKALGIPLPKIRLAKGVEASGKELKQKNVELIAQMENAYTAAVKAGDLITAQRLVDKAAQFAGYSSPQLFRGTVAEQPPVLPESFEAGIGIFLTDSEDVADIFRYPREYGELVTERYSEETDEYEPVEPGPVMRAYVRFRNPLRLSSTSTPTAQQFTDDTMLQARTLRQARAAGHDGVIAEGVREGVGDTTARGTTYVALDSANVKSAEPITFDDDGRVVPLAQRFNVKSLDVRFQEAQKESGLVRGSIYFNSKAEQAQMDGVLAVIRGFSAANVTTPIHEAAHFYHRFMLNVENGFTPEEIKAAEDWAGAQNGKWSVKAEEKWARGFERYLRSGESPLPSLARLFEKMAKWFQGVYKVVAGSPIDVEITPEIKRVFDRMFELQAERVQASKGPQTLKQEVEGPSGEAQAPVWRSNIIEALGDWKQNKGTPAQLMAHLNKTKGAAEEAKWIGLNEFLQGKPTVTRAQIEDFVSKNPYIVSDTTIKGGIYSGYTLFGGSNYREIILTSPKVPFTSGHFGNVPNYLAHMRVKNFKDSEGRKVLLVEEAQSDLHQKGRKAGYETPETQRKIAALNKQLTALQRQRADVAQDAFDATYKLAQKLTDPQNDISTFNVLVEIQELHARIAQALPRPPLRRQGNTPTVTGKQIADFASGRTPTAGVNVQALAHRAGLRKQFNEVLEKLQLRHDLAGEIAQAEKSINKIKGDLLPDVPFKGSENWGVMVFKRAIRMAVEEGADVVAWTPGKVQQERYQNLGGDLSTFYDKILPTALGKFVRQWGGKVETIDLTPSLDSKESLRLLVTDELRGQIRYFETRLEEASDEGYDDEGRTTEEILHELNGLHNSLGQAATASDAELNRMLSELPAGPGAAFYEQTPREGFPAIVITPQMKGEAEKGFTLFQAEGVPEDKEGVNYAEIGRKIVERRAEAAKKAKEGQGAAPPQPSAKQQARPSGPTRRPLKVKPPKSLEEMLSDVEKDIQAKAGKASRTSQEEANYRADREVRSLLKEYALKAFQGRFGDELELPDGTKVSRRAELLSAIAELQAILKDPALRQNQRLIDRAKVYRRIDYALLAPPKVSKKINPSLRNKLTGHAWGEWSPRSPLSYAQYIGSYERLAGATGRDVSDTFNLVRTMFAREQYRNFAGAMSDLRLRLRPLKDQLREQGYHGLPALIDAHVERLEDATRNIGELTWANVKKAWDENPVNLVSTLAKAFIFNAKLRFSIKSIGLNFIQPLSTLYPYFTASELADLYKRSLTKSEIERVRAIAIAESGGRFTQEMREGVKSRLPNPFQRSSEQVRIMGHLAGEMLADRDKMPPGIERDMFIRSWAEKAEFDNSPWNIGPLFSGPIASVLLQFKPFMFKNLERFATDIRPQKTDKSWVTARQAKVILTQLGIGGMSSLMTLVPVVGTALIGPGMLALLAKSLGAIADDDELGEQLAEAFYYGAPSLFGVDLSSSVEFISEPMGKTAAEQVLNVIGGPLVATSVSAYTQGKDMVSLAMRPQKVGEKEEVDKKLREKALRLSKSITPLAGMAEAAAGLATGNRPTMFLNEKEPYTTGETARKMFGFTPLRQTIYYDRKESPGFIQKFAGRQPDVPGITREKGETDATYRVRVQRVEEYRQKYGDQLLAHPRYKTLDEETKQKALEIINGNISTESAKKRPDVRNLNPLYVMRRAKESIRQAPRREKKQLYVPPDED